MSGQGVPAQVRKRDGSIVAFDPSRIERAIHKAALDVLAVERQAHTIARRVTKVVVERLAAQFRESIPEIEDIQDVVEAALMSEGYSHVAKSYILYRESRSQVRLAKSALGLKDDLKLSVNAIEVLRRRYLLRDNAGQVTETPSEMFRRVAHHVAQAEANHGPQKRMADIEERFYRMMRHLEFVPNSPTLMNAGTALGQLSACFVIPVEDSIEGIFEALGEMARIHQTGGGTGFSFSRLRPRGDLVGSTKGYASGPVSFVGIFDKATEVIVQGGKRRGANMGILRCDHPDIVDFIEAKTSTGAFENFNLSVVVTNEFMRAVIGNRPFDLINPRTRRRVQRVSARSVFDLIINAAWRTGDPGLIFVDQINRHNPTPEAGAIEATNPCGEVPLLPYESCILGSINLAKMVRLAPRGGSETVDWEKLRETIQWAVRFLDDVVDVNRYPLESIRAATVANRKIGLGVMGFADLLIRLGTPYNTPDAAAFARRLMRFVHEESLAASAQLARKRGVFPNFRGSVHAKAGRRLRNATVNSIAPTGTISIIAGCSSGIEPLFAISFVRNVLSGTRLLEANPWFEKVAKERGFHSSQLLAEVARHPSLKRIKGIPRDVKRLFTTTFDVSAHQHLEIQAAFQRYTDNAVSKTINLPAEATVDDVRDIYLAAYRLRCKGITIYRYGSKPQQVLSVADADASQYDDPTTIDPTSPRCAAGLCDF
jgi:ribonucleoside-diphosphate reductase alpha chain